MDTELDEAVPGLFSEHVLDGGGRQMVTKGRSFSCELIPPVIERELGQRPLVVLCALEADLQQLFAGLLSNWRDDILVTAESRKRDLDTGSCSLLGLDEDELVSVADDHVCEQRPLWPLNATRCVPIIRRPLESTL